MHIDHSYVSSSVKTLLKKLVSSDRRHHLYVFACPKAHDAAAIAKLFLLEYLGVCWPKTEDPDLVELQSSGKVALHSITAIRSLLDQLSLAPFGNRGRGVIIEAADRMLAPAANALLKILEEPPPKTTLVLATDAPQKLLPTIVSRSQVLRFPSQASASSPYLHHVVPILRSLQYVNYSQLRKIADAVTAEMNQDKETFLATLSSERIHDDMTSQAKAEIQQELDGSSVLWMQTQARQFLEDLYLAILGRNTTPSLRSSASPDILVQLLLKSLDGIDRGADFSDMCCWFLSQAVTSIA
jgi:DNA polymerase III delta prime subunit